MLVGMYAGIIDGPAALLRSILSREFLTLRLHHLQMDRAMARTMMPPTTIPAKAALLKPLIIVFDVEEFVGDELELVGVGFEPAVGVTTPAPVLTAFPVVAGVVANPPKGVSAVPPYWLTCEIC